MSRPQWFSPSWIYLIPFPSSGLQLAMLLFGIRCSCSERVDNVDERISAIIDLIVHYPVIIDLLGLFHFLLFTNLIIFIYKVDNYYDDQVVYQYNIIPILMLTLI